MLKTKLFCLPYVGGSFANFKQFELFLHDSVELVPIELKGRGKRKNEPSYHCFHDAVVEMADMIPQLSNNHPYILFGHSMGGLLSYAITTYMQKEGFPLPIHVIISSSFPPQSEHYLNLPFSNYSDKDIIEYILSMDYTQHTLFYNNRTCDIYLRRIRNDYKFLESYNASMYKSMLDIPVSILHGTSDLDIEKELYKWDTVSCKKVNYYRFDGGHFFIHRELDKVAQLVSKFATSFYEV